MRLLPSLLLLLSSCLFSLLPTSARAAITLSVDTTRAQDAAADAASFGSTVKIVHGIGQAAPPALPSALVTGGVLPCLPTCNVGLGSGAHAFAELDGERMRFAFGTVGSGADATSASTSATVSDTLSLVGWNTPGTVDVSLHVRIELATDVDRGAASQAAAAYTYFLDGPEGGFGDVFAFVAESASNAIPDPGNPQGLLTQNEELYEVLLEGVSIESGSTIPAVYETVVTIPVPVGPGQPNSFGFVWSVGGGGFTDGAGGRAELESLHSSYLGIRVSRGSFVSANGYAYPGYVPEPESALLLISGASGLALIGRRNGRGGRRRA